MPEPSVNVVEIFTDGACSPNPGPGGWGAILRYGGREKEIYGGEPATTNNRMEIMAAIRGLESLTRPSAVHVHTDSVYLRNGITRWLPTWKRNGWKTSDKKPVKNADLWTRLDSAARRAHRAVVLGQGSRGASGERARRRAGLPGVRGSRRPAPAGRRGHEPRHGQGGGAQWRVARCDRGVSAAAGSARRARR